MGACASILATVLGVCIMWGRCFHFPPPAVGAVLLAEGACLLSSATSHSRLSAFACRHPGAT